MGKYIVRNGVLAGRKFRLEHGARILIGREKGDLNFPDKRMSRGHCVLEARDEGDYVEDSNSTNGTFVNDDRVKLRHLTPGDIIRIGFTELEFLGMPEHVSLGLAVEPGQAPDPNKTIAFRRSDARAAVEARRRPRPKSRARAKLDEAKKAAMGLGGGLKLISAKGKFCEACGEAIFMREGAPDEGRMLDGLYLCRMCALIAEKQKDAGGDYLPSYAKIVGGRLGGPGPPIAGDVGSLGVEIASVDEISLDELDGERPLAGEEVEDKPGEEVPEEEAAGDNVAEEEVVEDEAVEKEAGEERAEKGEEAESRREAEEKLDGKPNEKHGEPVRSDQRDEAVDEGEETKKDGTSPSDTIRQSFSELQAGAAGEPGPEETAGEPSEEGAARGRDLGPEDILAAMDATIEAAGVADNAGADDEGEVGGNEAGEDEAGDDKATDGEAGGDGAC